MKVKISREIHPWGAFPDLVGKIHYIYKIGRVVVSLIRFGPLVEHSYFIRRGLRWELYGGRFRNPTHFRTKREAEEAIEKVYKVKIRK